jgi:hypothetical protein
MTDLGVTLRDHARRFRKQQQGAAFPKRIRDTTEEAIGRLVDWSMSNAPHLADRGPEGVDPAFGVVPAGGLATVWRVYPRGGGGKVTLLSRAEHFPTPAERKSVILVLEQLQPGTRIGKGQRLEIGLPRIAPDAQWVRFAPLLDLALEVAKRHIPPGPAA